MSQAKLERAHIADESCLIGERSYRHLYRKFIFFTLICSLTPLLLLGWGIHLYYSGIARDRMTSALQTQVEYHENLISLFLNERRSELQIIAGSHTLEELADGNGLRRAFELINQDAWSFTDLGVIDEAGRHLQYIGPFHLKDQDYSRTDWFQEVMKNGIYISDMFVGFRREPHFIIAVLQTEGDLKWVLRATVDTEYFRSLVENVRIGQTGEVYLLNKEGRFQTTPRFGGKIMDSVSFPMPSVFDGSSVAIRPEQIDEFGGVVPAKLVCQVWLKNPRWLLLVQQDYDEAYAEVNHANTATLIFLHLSAAAILLAAVLITRHMISILKKRDREAERLHNQLLQAGKLAAIGELSAGVAHDINNPLAIISTERQIMLDALEQSAAAAELRDQFLDSLGQIQIQTQRCKRLIHNLLRFARRTESVIEPLDINEFMKEVMELIEREARGDGIRLAAELDPNLPSIQTDPSQLQQVVLNLITNAIDAHEKKTRGFIRVHTEIDEEKGGLRVQIQDSGSGIPPDLIERIFDPFFTTKPVGKGTGLGLPICRGIMNRLGGSINVVSELGQGSTFTLFLPAQPPMELKNWIQAETHRRFASTAPEKPEARDAGLAEAV